MPPNYSLFGERLKKAGWNITGWTAEMVLSDTEALYFDLRRFKEIYTAPTLTRDTKVDIAETSGQAKKAIEEIQQIAEQIAEENGQVKDQSPKPPLPVKKDNDISIGANPYSPQVRYPAQVELNIDSIRRYFCKDATEEEAMWFLQLCRYRNLNPFLKEAYLIKYGNEPAAMVVGIDAFQKRAEQQANYDGLSSGIVVTDASGQIKYRDGTLIISGETLVGGWAEVFRKDRGRSTRVEVALEEYIQRRKDGQPNKFWSKMPGTMIRKVAKVQALREAFATEFGGMYAAEEFGEVSG